MPSIIQRISLISFIFLSFLYSTSFSAFAQEYKVESFTVVQDDLSARTNPKIDNNGKKCAMIKVYVDDRISAVRGNIFGEVTTLGMEKSFYITDGSKKLELVFDTHYPLKIVFDDYNIPALTGGMTYVLKLKAEGGSSQSTTTTQTNNQTAQTNYQSTKQTNTHTNNIEKGSAENLEEEMRRNLPPSKLRNAIENVSLRLEDADGKETSSYDQPLISFNANYIQARLEFKPWKEKSKDFTLQLRVFLPNGKPIYLPGKRYTAEMTINLKKSKKNQMIEFDLFGTDVNGFWKAGEYKLEVLEGGDVIHTTTFNLL